MTELPSMTTSAPETKTLRLYYCLIHGYMSEPWKEASGETVCSMYGDHASCGLTVDGPFAFKWSGKG